MPVFEVKGKDGKVYEVKAENYERAAAVVNEAPEPSVNVGEDVLRSGAAGLGKGVIATAGTPGDVREGAAGGAEWLAKKFGLSPEAAQQLAMSVRGGIGIMPGFTGPTTGTLTEAANKVTRPAPSLTQLVTGEKPRSFMEYEPKTPFGEGAQTLGEFAPGFVMGPGGRVVRAAETIGAAGLSEGLGQATKGTTWEPAARLGGAVLGSVTGRRLSYRPTETDLIQSAVPRDLSDYRALGDEAMVLDASPSMVGLAQGIASTPGAQKNLLVQALRDREMGRTGRLQADTVGAMGPAQDADLLKQSLQRTGEQQAGPMYDQAYRGAPQLPQSLEDTAAVQLTTPAEHMALSARGANRGIMDEIDDALAAGNPEVTARRLHDVRKRLDAQIVYDPRAVETLSSADKANQGVLKNARATVDDILKNRIPGFSDADEVVAHSKRLQDDIDYGRGALEGGKYATTTDRFRQDMQGRNPQAVGAGMRHDINVATGTQSNDLPALRKKVGGDADFNRDKLADIFGQGAVDRMAGGVRREETFSRNYADIDRNSQTQQRKEAVDVVRGTEPPKITGQETLTGMGLKGAVAVANSLLRGARVASTQPARDALVRALMTRGPAGEALMMAARAAPSAVGSAATKALINALLSTSEARVPAPQ